MNDRKVLIVDDSPAVLDSLSQSLERLGVDGENIHRAASAQEALELFATVHPTVVFMDIQLGPAWGDEVAFKMLEANSRTKIVIMTGMDVNDRRVRGLVSGGAYEVIEKPLRLARLRQVLELIDTEEKGLRRV